MATSTKNSIQPALLFMPDISGFTEFVNNTEIAHAQSIIQEVIEILIESNELNLELGEIEGDAVFFYRLGKPPHMKDLVKQVESMFTKFHQHIQLYDHQRICPCGACTNAVKLKLKIIAHFGEVGGYSIKQHRKLFGRDVIVLHRLLKNNLNKNQYVLFTESLMEGAEPLNEPPTWYKPESGTEYYDVGTINFTAIDLTELHDQMPKVEPLAFKSYQKASPMFTEEKIIPAPISEVFTLIFDLKQRTSWMDGVKGVEIIGHDHINRRGTMHRCLVNEKNNPVLVTSYASLSQGGIELVEMDNKGIGGCRFCLIPVTGQNTLLKIEMLVKNNPLVRLFFRLTIKNKFRKSIIRSMENLRHLCMQPKVIVHEEILSQN
jgi:hypothetical protein